MAGRGSHFSGLFALTTTCLLITSNSFAQLRAPELYVGAEFLEIVMNTLPYDSNLTEEVKADSLFF